MKPWETAIEVGCKVRQIWAETAAANGLDISVSGLPALSSYSFASKKALAYKTLITQEFLKRGYLAGTILYASNAHDTTKFDEYAAILDNVFKLIADCENGQSLNSLLDGPICHAGFKRLN